MVNLSTFCQIKTLNIISSKLVSAPFCKFNNLCVLSFCSIFIKHDKFVLGELSVLKDYANIDYDKTIKRRYIWNNCTTNIQNIIEI